MDPIVEGVEKPVEGVENSDKPGLGLDGSVGRLAQSLKRRAR
jgi:hypothetical protein